MTIFRSTGQDDKQLQFRPANYSQYWWQLVKTVKTKRKEEKDCKKILEKRDFVTWWGFNTPLKLNYHSPVTFYKHFVEVLSKFYGVGGILYETRRPSYSDLYANISWTHYYTEKPQNWKIFSSIIWICIKGQKSKENDF